MKKPTRYGLSHALPLLAPPCPRRPCRRADGACPDSLPLGAALLRAPAALLLRKSRQWRGCLRLRLTLRECRPRQAPPQAPSGADERDGGAGAVARRRDGAEKLVDRVERGAERPLDGSQRGVMEAQKGVRRQIV